MNSVKKLMSGFIKRLFSLQTILIGCFILFFLFLIYVNEKNIVAIKFVDEDDNFVVGWYLLQGQKIYSDLFSHHQPLAYIMSAGIQFLTNPNSIFLLIKRHREVMILWMLIWNILLLWRFRSLAIPFVVLFELSKSLLLGTLFLSEGQVVYPLVYMVFVLLGNTKNIRISEIIFLGFCTSFVVFQLSPLWPLLLAMCLVLFLHQRKTLFKTIGLFFIGFLPLGILSFSLSSIPAYLYSVFVLNGQYYIPLTTHEPFVVSAIKGFLTPLLVFIDGANTLLTWIIRAFVVVLFINTYFLFKTKQWKTIMLVYGLLGLANIRFIQPGVEIYGGFHLLPWYALLIGITSYLSVTMYHHTKKLLAKRIWMLLFLLMIGIVALQNRGFLFTNRDVALDLYVNYAHQSDIGEAIRILKQPEDTLFVLPAKSLLYWQGKIAHASFMFFYYPWMRDVPSLSAQKNALFQKNPPTFVYCDCPGESYTTYAVQDRQNDYKEILQDRKRSGLFVLKKRLKTITPQQKSDIGFYRFEIK